MNYTASYRTDSTIPIPYLIFQPNKNITISSNISELDYAANKTRKVAWIVSNTVTNYNSRFQYASELNKYIPVDIFGKATYRKCDDDDCWGMLRRHYKVKICEVYIFYFHNS